MKSLLTRICVIHSIRSLLAAVCVLPLTQCANFNSSQMADAMPASPPAGGARSEMAVLKSRPGLGTGVGDERYDSVTKGQFIRKAGGPDATSVVHYNDAEGAKVMTESWDGSSWSRGGSFSLAGGRLKGRISTYGGTCRHYRAGDRIIVIGEPGADWQLHLDNESGHRVEVVVSVDGLDVLDGKAAKTGKPGYLIEKNSSLTISGWRIDSSRVREFRFASVADSKAAAAGRARNVGVIGVAVFEEDEAAVRRAREAEAARRDAARAFGD